jgi:hypothetical protein
MVGRIIACGFVFILLVAALMMRRDGEALTHVDAVITKTEHMCIPYDRKRSKIPSRHARYYKVYPEGWTKFGKPCSQLKSMAQATLRRYSWMNKYWVLDVEFRDIEGVQRKGHISTYGKPLTIFKNGTAHRDPEATRGLNLGNLDWRTQPKVEKGDMIPVSYITDTGQNIQYAPNELEHTQYTFVFVGIAAIIVLLVLAFAGDGLPMSEEEKRYRDEHRAKLSRLYPNDGGTY